MALSSLKNYLNMLLLILNTSCVHHAHIQPSNQCMEKLFHYFLSSKISNGLCGTIYDFTKFYVLLKYLNYFVDKYAFLYKRTETAQFILFY